MTTQTPTPATVHVLPAARRQARVPLDHARTPLVRILSAWSRRRYGKVLEPGLAMLHHRRVLWTMTRLELSVERWSTLEPALKDLVIAAVSAHIGCSWCIDFGWYVSRGHGLAADKLEHLADWRTAGVHTALERAALAYAEAMTATPPTVTDAHVDALRRHLSDEQIVELTAMISLENLRSRTNSALGLTSQGFSDHCEVPRR
jgi:AhpD family alkylhydroperoxidase